MKDLFIILLLAGLAIVGMVRCGMYVSNEYDAMLYERRGAELELDRGCEKACVAKGFTNGDARRIPHMSLNTTIKTVDCVCTRGTTVEQLIIPNPRLNNAESR